MLTSLLTALLFVIAPNPSASAASTGLTAPAMLPPVSSVEPLCI